jgi:hypothetical protein
MPNYLDDITGKTVTVNDVVYPDRKNLVIIGEGVSATDIPATNSTQLNIAGSGGGGAVTSVFGRIGPVAAANGDYTASQVNYVPDGLLITATNVQGAVFQAAQLGGEVNTLNPGTGTGESIVLPKVGADLYAKRVRGGANVSVSTVGNEIVIDGGASSPQSGVYGEFAMAATATTTLPAGAPTKLLGTTVTTQLRDFDDDGGVSNRLKYTGGFATKVAVEVSCSVNRVSAPGTARLSLQIYKNGTTLLEGEALRDNSTTTVGAMSTHAIADCAPGDYFEVYMTSTVNTDVIAQQINMMVTVSGGSVGSYDYVVSSKQELIDASASYAGGVITLNTGTYYGNGDIDLSEGGTSNDRIQGVSGASFTAADANSCVITGNTPAGVAVYTSPSSGRWSFRDVSIQNIGLGSVVESASDSSAFATLRNANLSASAGGDGCISITGSSVLVVDGGLLNGGADLVSVSGTSVQLIMRNGGFSSCTDAVHVQPGASCAALAWTAQSKTGPAPTNACILNEGTISRLFARDGGIEGGVYGIRNTGTVTACLVAGNVFNGGSTVANALSGISYGTQEPGVTYPDFCLVRSNVWCNSAGTLHAALEETGPVAPASFYLATGVLVTSGAGSPEGVVTAIVGSQYSRTDGGAGTSFYIKESGTGNTGWVAK